MLLSVIDNRWREHLYEMDYLQEGIGLARHGAEGPSRRVPARGLRHVPQMQETVKEDFARYMFHVEAVREDERQPPQMRQERRQIPMAQPAALRRPREARAGQPDDEELPIEQAYRTRSLATLPAPVAAARNTRCATAAPGRGSSLGPWASCARAAGPSSGDRVPQLARRGRDPHRLTASRVDAAPR